MKLIVVHDSKGNIVSLARVETEAKGRVQAAAGLRPGRGHSLLEVDLTSELAGRSLGEIHEGYRLDAKAKQLVARRSKGSAKRPR